MRNLLLTASLAALAAGPALAQEAITPEATTPEATAPEATAQAELGTGEIRALETWSYDPLYAEGWSVDNLMDEAEVYGVGGEEIGNIENIMFDAEGNVLAIIAEVGGFWDIGDTHVSVPWDQVEVSGFDVTIPVTEENVGDYDVFGEAGFYYDETVESVEVVNDDLTTGPNVFKASDIIGDYAYLTGGERYGYVFDLLVENDKLTAVIVDASAYGSPGAYAYPYGGYGAGYGWGTGVAGWRYDMPYGADEVTILDTFDYEQMNSEREASEG